MLDANISQAFDEGSLKQYKPYVAPVLNTIRAMPFLVYLTMFAPVLLIVLVILLKYSSSGVR